LAQFLGSFLSQKPRALQGYYDAPYLMAGRHALCGRNHVSDEGAAALAVGWIRNGEALRRELRANGRLLNADVSVSRLLLHAYRLWGEECIRKIEGPVILIVIDHEKEKLLLSADRMGEAGPVFYAVSGESVCFASHPAPLLEAPGVSRIVSADGWREIFGLGPARTPGKTPFRDILSLPAGHVLTADAQGCRVRRYFAIEAAPHEDDENTTIETVRSLIHQAVSDAAKFNPVSMLSGGLDSTVLTALLASRIQTPLRTYSIDYEGNEHHFTGGSYQPEQDAPYVERAVRAIGSTHTRVLLRIESLVDSLEEAMAARGFPGMADIDSSLLLFSRRIASEARHVVSGECGDEVFGGYPWFNREELIFRDAFPWSGSMALREKILLSDIGRTLRLSEYADDCWRDSLCRQPSLPEEDAGNARLRRLQGICFEYFMTNLQERAAAMGEAAGLTVLTPFCDDRLVQYAYNVPWNIKSLGGQEKGLLRSAMRGLLPDELLFRKKSPFPKTYHPLYAQLVKNAMKSILSDPGAPLLQLADKDEIIRLMEGDLSPAAAPWFGQLMTGPQMLAYLIQVNQWMLRYRVEVGI